ncbi:MAG TPA: four helix bundle protein, partial [Terriglobales bacterium]|nr:four helix bundle protein [Terriglobales bacterium]
LYRLTEVFPRHELYGLADQIRRAAVSVPSNIAEGQAHFSRPEFKRYLRHSLGSLAEMETQVTIAERLHYLSKPQLASVLQRIHEVGRIINGLVNSLRAREVA